MAREEERIEQIEQFASQCYEDGVRYSSFIAGAIWADNNPVNIWHDASEEPTKEPISILATDAKGFTDAYHFEKGGTIRIQRCRVNWAGAVLYFGLTKWAYIEDLLPKGGEK